MMVLCCAMHVVCTARYTVNIGQLMVMVFGVSERDIQHWNETSIEMITQPYLINSSLLFSMDLRLGKGRRKKVVDFFLYEDGSGTLSCIISLSITY